MADRPEIHIVHVPDTRDAIFAAPLEYQNQAEDTRLLTSENSGRQSKLRESHPTISERSSLLTLVTNAGEDLKLPYSSYTPEIEDRTIPVEPPKVRSLGDFWSYGWVAEQFSCVLAILSFAAIIVILLLRQNKPLPDWPFTINAIVAVLAVAVKGGLIGPLSEGLSQIKWDEFRRRSRPLHQLERYDSASRGPFGSLLLIFDGKISTFSARLAAFATIMLFISDPFTQQILNYAPIDQVRQGANASIAQSNFYFSDGNVTGHKLTLAELQMTTSIKTALYDQSQSPSVSMQCNSGNCTFPLFSSLGMCQSCNDVTGMLTVIDSSPSSYDVSFFEAELGRSIQLTYPNLINSSVYPTPLKQMSETTPPYVLGFTVLIYSNLGLQLDPAIFGFKCTLAPCVRQYNSQIKNGVAKEVVLSNAPIGLNLDYGNSQTNDDYMFLLATSRTMINGTWQKCNSTNTNNSSLIAVQPGNVDTAPGSWNSTVLGSTDSNSMEYYTSNCVWGLSTVAAESMSLALVDELENVSLTKEQYQIAHGEAPTEVTQVVAPVDNTLALALYSDGTGSLNSTSKFMQNIADSMSNTMRSFGSQGTPEWQAGEEHYSAICLKVQWPWISFLGGVLFLSILFLLKMVLASHRSIRVWKSSTLAMLLCAVDENIVHETMGARTKQEIVQISKSVQAQLIDDGDGRARFCADTKGGIKNF